jgi:hypothetical protein
MEEDTYQMMVELSLQLKIERFNGRRYISDDGRII